MHVETTCLLENKGLKNWVVLTTCSTLLSECSLNFSVTCLFKLRKFNNENLKVLFLFLQSTFEHRRTGDQRTWIATSQLQLPEQETISSIIHASIDPYRNISANISIENLYSSPVLGNCTNDIYI